MPTTPDAVLASLPRRHQVAACAIYHDGAVSLAVRGAPDDSRFELGSISKGITGLLYHVALDRGEVTADTTLAQLLDLPADGVGKATLGAIATHTSGMPSLPKQEPPRSTWARTWTMWRKGINPYGDSLEVVLADAARTKLRRPTFRYSNLGFMLMGHALASAAGTTYRELLDARIAQPLGITLTAAHEPSELGPQDLRGRSKHGRAHEAWVGEGLGPAGGIRASIADVGTLVSALVAGDAPGITALDPVTQVARKMDMGAAWVVFPLKGRTVTWHNGRTGGFASWLGVERDAGVGVAVLSATAASVDRAGMNALLTAT